VCNNVIDNISTKEKVQAYISLDMDVIKAKKANWIKNRKKQQGWQITC